jgi:hypothetical protein
VRRRAGQDPALFAAADRLFSHQIPYFPLARGYKIEKIFKISPNLDK